MWSIMFLLSESSIFIACIRWDIPFSSSNLPTYMVCNDITSIFLLKHSIFPLQYNSEYILLSTVLSKHYLLCFCSELVSGESSNGRIAAFEAVRPGSNPGSPTTIIIVLRGGETVSRRAHNPKIAGSIPAPANYSSSKVVPGWWNW